MGLSQAGQLNEQKTMKKELDAAQRRLSKLATLVQRIYEDNVFGRLSDDLYQTLSAKYEAETKELKTRATEIQALLTEATTKTQGIQDFTETRLRAQCGVSPCSSPLQVSIQTKSPAGIRRDFLFVWTWRDSNPWPLGCEPNALPTELQAHIFG